MSQYKQKLSAYFISPSETCIKDYKCQKKLLRQNLIFEEINALVGQYMKSRYIKP